MQSEGTLSTVWERHVAAEFVAKDVDQAVATMTADAHVSRMPLMIGARGRDRVRDFYANHFVSQPPADLDIMPVSRTIGQNQVVDELVLRFTHSIRTDWLLPGLPPTGKRVEPGLRARRAWSPRWGAPRSRRRDRDAGAGPRQSMNELLGAR